MSMDLWERRAVVLATLAGASLLIASSWQTWRWIGRNRAPGESSNAQLPPTSHVSDDNGASEHSELRASNGKCHSETREHGHHEQHHRHHHQHHQHAKTLSSRTRSKHSSGTHGETERLLHSRSLTEPNYSGTSHHIYDRPEAAKRSSQVLPFHDTHDEPASLPHPDDRSEEVGKKRGISSLSGSRNGMRPYRPNGHPSHSIEDDCGKCISADDLRFILERSVERIVGTLRVEHPEDFSDHDDVYDLPRVAPAPTPDAPGKRYRSLAVEQGKLRKAAYENSKRAYKSGRKADAKRLSDEGKLHDENIKKYNSLAAAEIFAANNPRYNAAGRQLTRCDLHGLHVEEALEYSKNHLVNCRGAGTDKTMLIVGRGSHSQQGGARIKPAIMAMLDGIAGIAATVHEKNEGCIVVDFIATG